MTRLNPKKIIKVFLIISICIILIPIIYGSIIFFSIKLEDSSIISPNAMAIILDADSNELPYKSSVNNYIAYDYISPSIVNAFIALEDKRFYKHNGIDYYRLCGAMVNNLKAHRFKEGGSTITQQLAKNLQLTGEKTISRKIKEARLAFEIEKKYTKNQIIEMYLNAIYFGNGLYGIDAACKAFFNKIPLEINTAEGAILAGVVNNPLKNSPINSKENSQSRKNIVLNVMLEQKLITDAEYNEAKNYTISNIDKSLYYGEYSPYINATLEQASNLLGITEKDVITNGYTITTYLDRKTQQTMFQSFKSKEFITDSANPSSYLTLMADNDTAGINGFFANFNSSVITLRRQPASAIKPIISYAPALDIGYISPSSMFEDRQYVYNNYSPSNYNDIYYDWIDVRTALKKSVNSVSVKLLDEIGIDYAKSVASSMGLKFSPQDQNLAIGLGGMHQGVTMTEITSAYMTLANGGKYKELSFIKEIKDIDGKVIYNHIQNGKAVISPESAYLLTDILKDTAKSGTAKKLSSLPFEIACKTGTNGYANSDQNSDAWNMSYTSENTLCVWYGNLEQKIENRLPNFVTGGSYPTLLARYLYSMLEKKPGSFAVPDGIIELALDTYAINELKRPILVSENTPEQFNKLDIFDVKYAPTEISTFFDPQSLELNLTLTTNESIPKIEFDTSVLYNYKVYKRNITGGTSIIAELQGNGERVKILDNDIFGINYLSYYVEVYLGEKLIFTSEEQKTLLFKWRI